VTSVLAPATVASSTVCLLEELDCSGYHEAFGLSISYPCMCSSGGLGFVIWRETDALRVAVMAIAGMVRRDMRRLVPIEDPPVCQTAGKLGGRLFRSSCVHCGTRSVGGVVERTCLTPRTCPGRDPGEQPGRRHDSAGRTAERLSPAMSRGSAHGACDGIVSGGRSPTHSAGEHAYLSHLAEAIVGFDPSICPYQMGRSYLGLGFPIPGGKGTLACSTMNRSPHRISLLPCGSLS
jgi:hypothetical protein